MTTINYMHVGDTIHCLYCHESTKLPMHKHIQICDEYLDGKDTSPCTETCGKYFKSTQPTEGWKTEFREYFDKTLKPKKPTMGNLDRELCVDFIDKLLSQVKAEVVICAAIKLKDGRVLRCHRHGDGMLNAHHNGWELAEGIEQQGFITSKGRYVSREEGRKLQDAAGVKSVDPEGYRGTTIFSEDLY